MVILLVLLLQSLDMFLILAVLHRHLVALPRLCLGR